MRIMRVGFLQFPKFGNGNRYYMDVKDDFEAETLNLKVGQMVQFPVSIVT